MSLYHSQHLLLQLLQPGLIFLLGFLQSLNQCSVERARKFLFLFQVRIAGKFSAIITR